MHDELLRRYFEEESAKGDLSANQWQNVLSQVKIQKQRRGVWRGAVTSLATRRPLLAMAATLVLAVVAGGTFLWVTAPWAGSSFDGPILGPRSSPAPQIVGIAWKVDKRLIRPGEPITITLGIKNVWDKPVVFSEFPTTMMLIDIDKGDQEPILLELEGWEATTGSIEPGNELTVIANISSSVSAGLQSGRYGLRFDFRFAKDPGRAEMRDVGMGFSSGRVFVVLPPEGALEGTVAVGQARDGNGASITLDSIHFTREETSIVAMASTLANWSEVSRSEFSTAPAPTATPAIPQQDTPKPAVAQPAWDGDITELTAFYRLDGGIWYPLRNHGYRETPNGVHHEWTFGPVSVDTNTLEFAIVPGVRPGRDGVFAYPTNDGTSPWEWTVLL